MTDIALLMTQASPTAAPAFDIALAGHDVAADDGLRTSVQLSLFLDRRAQADDVGEGADRRGSWMDQFLEQANDKLGSRLWLLAREKETPDTLARAKAYAEESLAWLVEDGIARRVTVEAEWARAGAIGLRVTIERAEGGKWEEVFRYSTEQ